MRSSFIYLAQFDRAWSELGLGEEELTRLEEQLIKNPDAGDVIPGLEGHERYESQLRTMESKVAVALLMLMLL